tara:strand:- start:1800 stop:2189 length:390 start_codon:yes stop_codon:yes gene_type:complete
MKTASNIQINETKVAELNASRIVSLRAKLADVKEALENEEAQFKALGVDSVTLADGTKVAVVNQTRRSIDNASLKDVLPQGQFQRVTKRVGDMKLIDGAIDAGWLDADVVGQAINTKDVSSVKVTQPKR